MRAEARDHHVGSGAAGHPGPAIEIPPRPPGQNRPQTLSLLTAPSLPTEKRHQPKRPRRSRSACGAVDPDPAERGHKNPSLYLLVRVAPCPNNDPAQVLPRVKSALALTIRRNHRHDLNGETFLGAAVVAEESTLREVRKERERSGLVTPSGAQVHPMYLFPLHCGQAATCVLQVRHVNGGLTPH